ncbi:FAD binding domain-containing protein [Verrucomicrobiales bacterium BCK34]|nr:FAD binding domain-containing protein [Verrucomicrobiales bacterium BCK34]
MGATDKEIMQSWFTFQLDGEECRVKSEDTHKSLAHYLSSLDPCFAHYAEHDAWKRSRLVILGSLEDDCHRFRVVDSGLVFLPMLAGKQIWTAQGIQHAEPDHPAQLALQGSHFECSEERLQALRTLMFEGYYRPDLRRQGQINDQFDAIITRTANVPMIREAAAQVFASTEQLRHEAALQAEKTGQEATVWTGRKDIFGDRFTRSLFQLKNQTAEHYVDESKKRFFRPSNLVELLKLKREYPDAQLIAGGTHLGMNIKNVSIPNLISVEDVRELSKLIKTEENWEIGAATPLTRVAEQIGRECPQITKIFRRFATRPIRNRATLGGYLATARGSGQISPLLFALNARVILLSENGERDAPISQFYDRNSGTIIAPGEVIRSIIIPRHNHMTLADRGISSRLCDTYTSGRRRTLTEPYVSAAFAFELRDRTIAKAWIAYSGIDDIPLRVREAEEFITGKPWKESTVFETLPVLKESVTVKAGSGNAGEAEYKMQLVGTLFQKFYYQHPKPDKVLPEHLTATSEFARLDEPFFDALPD